MSENQSRTRRRILESNDGLSLFPSYSTYLPLSVPLLSLTALCISRAETTLAQPLRVSPNPTANPPIEK